MLWTARRRNCARAEMDGDMHTDRDTDRATKTRRRERELCADHNDTPVRCSRNADTLRWTTAPPTLVSFVSTFQGIDQLWGWGVGEGSWRDQGGGVQTYHQIEYGNGYARVTVYSAAVGVARR